MAEHVRSLWPPALSFAVTLVLLFLLSGCQSVPPELVAANVIQEQALEAVQADEEAIVDAYDRELRLAYRRHLDERMQYLLAQHAVNGSVPLASVTELIAQKNLQLSQIDAKLDQKREEFRQNPNLELVRKLNAAEGRYTRALSEAAQRLEALLGSAVPAEKRKLELDFIKGGDHE